MIIKHEELEIPVDNPFENCKLKRKQYASVLTDIVSKYADGFVLAIDNEWGTGKTTFVKMWKQQLMNDGYKTLYFNAWENDFDSSPLVAIMSELKTLESGNKNFDKIIEKGAIIVKSVLPALLKAILSKYIDAQAILDAIENVTKSTTEILESEIKDYKSKKEGLIEFRNELSEFIKDEHNSKPIVFIIDELDRCRPDYAVETLEQIKHFFNVPGIVFVLSIDKKQLGCAIRGFYGSESINSIEYLRRFIDIEYDIPEPDVKTYCNYLFDYFNLNEFFGSNRRTADPQFRGEVDELLKFAPELFKHSNLTLRQIEKIFAHTRIVLNSFTADQNDYPNILIFLIFIRIINKDLFNKIRNKTVSLQDVITEVEKLLPFSIPNNGGVNLIVGIEACLFYSYNLYINFPKKPDTLLEPYNIANINIINERKLKITTRYYDSEDYELLINYINKFEIERYKSVDLESLFNKINLIEQITFS